MESFRDVGKRLSNWGRWDVDGVRDQRGTTNLLTPQRVAAAASCIVDGRVFDLGIPFGKDGPQPGTLRPNPMILVSETGVGQTGRGAAHYADDYVFMALQAASQWDSLAHIYYDEQLYNGFPASSVTPHGAEFNGIDNQAKGVAGRGVLIDVARHRGVDWLRGGEAIQPDELDACLAEQGVELRGGDIVAVRTGWRKKFLTDRNAAEFMGSEPGLGFACADWLHEHEVAAVCSDNFGVEVIPPEGPDPLPLHMVLIRDMGMTLGEILDFEELAEDCALDGRYDFFFAGPPIKFRNAIGSPINPLAIK